MRTNRFLASTALAALLALGSVTAPLLLGTADAQTAVTVGEPKELIGRTLLDEQGNNIGEIENVLIDKDGNVKYVIAGVGGFLGLGEKYVALRWDDLTITDNGEKVTANVTKAQLEALPGYTAPESAKPGTVYSYDDAVGSNPYLSDGGIAQAPDSGTAAAPESAIEPAVGGTGLRASEIMGAAVTDAAGANIGEISEVIVKTDGAINGVVVDVGGFLGIGEHPVLLGWKDLSFTGTADNLSAVISLNKDQLGALPEFKATM